VHVKRFFLMLLALAAVVAAAGFVPQAHPVSAFAVSAFPGAEGFGTATPGGRGGRVCLVTNLNDSGPGSLRSCVDMAGPRYVVFRTGGTIVLETRLNVVQPYLTIAGQTAPGEGITLRMDPVSPTDLGTMDVLTHDVVIRYLRFRPGNGTTGEDSDDALAIVNNGVSNVVVDHCSFSWAVDENVNTYDGTTDITVSNSIIAEGLNNSGHPKGAHSKGLLAGGIGAHNVSIHHNLFVSNVDRNPQISGVSVADVRNNVVHNYGTGSGGGVTLVSSSKGVARVNWVGNFYKPGPNSDPNRAEFATYNGDTGLTQQWYGEGNARWTPAGVLPARVGQAVGQVGAPFPAAPVTTTSAEQAYADVLAGAGASRVRDAVDARLVAEVLAGSGSVKDAAGPYPELAAGAAPVDSDGDGMPDTYESVSGTNRGAPDGTGDVNGNGYDNIEDWFNSLVVGGAPAATVAIDAGAARTRTVNVRLGLAAAGPVPEMMRFKNDGDGWSAWSRYAAATTWKLEKGGDGKRTVLAQFADADGRQSAPVSDFIVLDTKPPAVEKAKPGPGATGVRRDTKLKVKLSEPLDPASVDSHSVVLKRSGASKKSKVAVKVTYRPGKHVIVATPRSKLAAGTTYKVKVRTTLVDLAGNQLKAKKKGGHGAHPLTWKFSTG
jgi:pectate lyase